MYLREIEIKGFKSFADKTILQFPKGISAIVGPNGSGKSNVVDALRWVLGEQSSKNLRTDSNVNLIFSGNEFKPAGQSAKVRLVFDDINREDIIETNTLEIEKIIYRDGKTEYFLNKKDARQKDLIELLASLQLGTKGLSIISQGSIENILKVSASERKIMFEEILGLRQLEIKKEASERKLENTCINLDKVNALVNEILPHFRSLKRYVSRFDKQQEYQDELISLCKKYYGHRFHVYQKNNENILIELQKYNNEIKAIESQIEDEKTKLGLSDSVDKNAISSLNLKQKEIENIVKELNSEKQKLVYEMAKLEGQIEEKAFAIKRLETSNVPNTNLNKPKPRFISFDNLELKFSNLKQLIKNILNSSDLYEIKSNIVAIEKNLDEILEVKQENVEIEPIDNSGRINELNSDISEIKNKILVFKNKIEEFDLQINQKDSEANQIEDEIEAESAKQREMFSAIEHKQRELMNLQNKKQTFNLEFEKNNINIQNLKDQVSSMNLDFQFIIDNFELDSNISDIDLKSFYDKIEKLRAILNELGFVDQNIVDEYNDTQKRIEFLENQKNDLEKAVADLRLVIKELASKINDTFRNSIKEINSDFNKYLELIFGGGKGSLEIVELKEKVQKTEDGQEIISDDNEEKKIGLEIKVKLPKTKLDGVEALSGGEKSLVSIALLFAIVSQSKPPLLVLDEVDAALDEENTRKFSNILKDLSTKTQYLLITHNWLTMSSANVIYGVTIGKEKFSQILSLELEDSRDFMKN